MNDDFSPLKDPDRAEIETLKAKLLSIDQRIAALVGALEASGIVKTVTTTVGVIGFAILIATAWQIYADYADRREERIARAWETISRAVPGNSGKGVAIGYLLKNGSTLDGLKVSCFTTEPTDNNYDCPIGPVIADLHMSDKTVPEQSLKTIIGWNLSGSAVVNSSFDGAMFGDIDIRGTSFSGTRFENVDISGHAEQSNFFDVSIVNSSFSISTMGMLVRGEISGLRLEDSEGGTDGANWGGAWAYADNPPLIRKDDANGVLWVPLSGVVSGIVYCAPDQRLPEGSSVEDWADNCPHVSVEDAKRKYPSVWESKGN